MRSIPVVALALLVGACAQTTYRGQEQRAIKALSADEVASLLEGRGMGLAKAAELNGYPGPLHTLELARQLGLTAQQASASAALMKAHQARAIELGAELVEAERRLDAIFASRQAEAEAVDEAAARIGALQARLRAEHLKTHLAQTALLSAEQVRHYGTLRGYAHHHE